MKKIDALFGDLTLTIFSSFPRYHLECLDPPLEHVPIDEWYCPNCRPANDESLESPEPVPSTSATTRRRTSTRRRSTGRARTVESNRAERRSGKKVVNDNLHLVSC